MSKIRNVTAAVTLATAGLLVAGCAGTSPQAVDGPARPSAHGARHTQQAPATAPQTPAAPTATAGKTQPCAGADLDITLRRGASGTAGSLYQKLVFTNTGHTLCTLGGFPGVSYVRHQDGAQVGAAADRVGKPRTVTLAPGARAVAPLQLVDVQNYSQDRCGQVTASGLRVFPPNQKTSVFVPDRALACAKRSVHVLHVWSVRAAS